MPLPTPERIAKARQQADQAKARLQALEARASDAERKKDTRRKIILGGLLIDAASKDERYAKVVNALLARVERGNDRKAFDEWEPPKPANGLDPAPATPPDAGPAPSAPP